MVTDPKKDLKRDKGSSDDSCININPITKLISSVIFFSNVMLPPCHAQHVICSNITYMVYIVYCLMKMKNTLNYGIVRPKMQKRPSKSAHEKRRFVGPYKPYFIDVHPMGQDCP